jgi:hypothetical protein
MAKFNLKLSYIYTLSALGFIVSASSFALNKDINHVIVIQNTKHDISFPLRDVPLHSLRIQPLSNKIQQELNIDDAASPLTIKGYEGVGVGLGSYVVTMAAPDVSGAVGSTQYVESVQPDIAVFDKMTGAVAPGFPKPGSAIWSGFGGPCETTNTGSPNVRYDQMANRWVVTKEANANTTTGPFYQCIAISTTDDATGSYNRYAFPMDSQNNYSRIGIWTNGYYLGMNMFGPASVGPRVCAIDRKSMLLGVDASIECFQLGADLPPFFPTELAGTTKPIAGTPEFFFSINPPSNLSMIKFFADFTNPANARISSIISIPVNSFVKACSATGGNNCAVQPGTTNRLTLLSDRFSSRIVYRQFGDHGSFVASHNVQGPPPKLSPALRWYELRITDITNPLANPVVFQQQDYAPDSKNRFTGSLGIDKAQNIVMGYTVSSTAVHPSPELGYRNYFDPLSNLTTQALYTGLGSELDSNWSAFSAMSLDPMDSCTFWYASEYLKTDGIMNWSTSITHFKLPSCV